MIAIKIPPLEIEVIKLFNKHNVRYLIIGGHAVRQHGCNREAEDLDILLSPFDDNPERVFPVLKLLIGGIPQFTIDDLRKEKKQMQFKRDGRCLDILTSIDGVDTREALTSLFAVRQDEISFPFLSKRHLIDNLRASLNIQERKKKAIRDLQCLNPRFH